MRGEQFYRSQKKETSSLSQGMDENSRVENLSTFAFYKIFNRGAGEKRRKNFLASHRKERIRLRLLLLSLLLLLSNRRTIKQKWRTRSILFSFYSTHLSSAREREKDGCTRTRRGMMAVERGKCPLPWKLHGGQWHADTALSRVGTGARNWAMCRLARATTLYEHCGENIWFSRWPSATVKFRPHCFERRNVGRRGVGRGELVWFKSGRPPHDSSQS